MYSLLSIVLCCFVTMEFMTGCASFSSSSGWSYESTLVETQKSDALSREKIEQDLSRSHNNLGFTDNHYTYSDYLNVTAVPCTIPYLKARAKEQTAEKGFKERWNEKRIKFETEQEVKNSLKLFYNNKTCFDIRVITKNIEANNLKYWDISLELENSKKYPGKLTPFWGFADKTRTQILKESANPTAKTTDLDVLENFNLFSTACFPVRNDFSKPFTLHVVPRYKIGIEPIIFKWTASEGDIKI